MFKHKMPTAKAVLCPINENVQCNDFCMPQSIQNLKYDRSPKVTGIAKLLATSSSSRDSISPNMKYRRVHRRKELLRGVCRKNIKKIKVLQEQNSQAQKTISSLKKLLENLEEKNMISKDDSEILPEYSPGVDELLKRKNWKKTSHTPALKAFAHTLHFISPKAYEYLRECFDLCLPSQRTLSRWYESVDGRPGFTEESFIALKNVVDNTPYQIVANLVMDGIAIKNHVEYNHQRKEYQGYVDLGNQVCADTSIKAKEALILMVVALNASWKLPIGYFLIKSLPGSKRKILVVEVIRKVQEAGIKVIGFTSDGESSNITTNKCCGAKLVWPHLEPYFVTSNKNSSMIILGDFNAHLGKLDLKSSYRVFRKLHPVV